MVCEKIRALKVFVCLKKVSDNFREFSHLNFNHEAINSSLEAIIAPLKYDTF